MYALLDEYHLRHDVKFFDTEEEVIEYMKSNYKDYGGDITKNFAIVKLEKIYEYFKKVIQIEDGIRELTEEESAQIRSQSNDLVDLVYSTTVSLED